MDLAHCSRVAANCSASALRSCSLADSFFFFPPAVVAEVAEMPMLRDLLLLHSDSVKCMTEKSMYRWHDSASRKSCDTTAVLLSAAAPVLVVEEDELLLLVLLPARMELRVETDWQMAATRRFFVAGASEEDLLFVVNAIR